MKKEDRSLLQPTGFKTLKSLIPFFANWEILNEPKRNITSFQ